MSPNVYNPSKFAPQPPSKGKEATVKYIDPSYMIRSVPANADDSYYCSLLGQGAVHAAMAGRVWNIHGSNLKFYQH